MRFTASRVGTLSSGDITLSGDCELRDLLYRILSREPFASWQEDRNRTYRLGQLSSILESFASTEDSDNLRKSSQEEGRISHAWLRARLYPRLIGYIFQMAEVAVPRELFGRLLARIARLRPPDPAPC